MIDKIKAHNPDWLKEQEEKAKQLAEEKELSTKIDLKVGFLKKI